MVPGSGKVTGKQLTIIIRARTPVLESKQTGDYFPIKAHSGATFRKLQCFSCVYFFVGIFCPTFADLQFL